MKIDGGLQDLLAGRAAVVDSAQAGAAAGYDRLFAAETAHDPFLPVALVADEVDVDLGTYVAIALARSPMTVAVTANDLQILTHGRFILGLGSQVKPHITRRFSMPWTRPVARMREFVLALRAIWASWHEGTKLDFDGEFYHHTLSNPLFDPGPNPFGPPRIFLAAVGPRMTETAGEVADGVICHGFTSASYLQNVTMPAVQRGIDVAGRARESVEVCLPVFLATGPAGSDISAEIARARKQVAFYGSTPAYRAVLDHHGWGDLHDDLHRLSKESRWDDMTNLVTDEILNTFAVVADSTTLAKVLRERFGGLVDGLRLNVPYALAPEVWAPVIADLKEPMA